MPKSILRQTLGFDEIFDIIQPVDPQEVKLPRTENLDNMLSPNWDSMLDKFELGKFNSINGSSNLGEVTLSSILDVFLDKHYSFMLELIGKLLSFNITNVGANNGNNTKSNFKS